MDKVEQALTEAERTLLDLLGYRPVGGSVIEGVAWPAFRYQGQRLVRTREQWRALLEQAIKDDPFMALAAEIVFGRLRAREMYATALRAARAEALREAEGVADNLEQEMTERAEWHAENGHNAASDAYADAAQTARMAAAAIRALA